MAMLTTGIDEMVYIEVRATLRTVPPLAHQNTKISKFSNYQNSTKMGSIEEAIVDLKSQEHPNITATAKKVWV